MSAATPAGWPIERPLAFCVTLIVAGGGDADDPAGYGPATGVPRLLDFVAAAGLRATCYVAGSLAGSHPELVRRIAADGHALGGLGAAADAAAVRRDLEALAEAAGVRPRGWLDAGRPAGGDAAERLAGLGLAWQAGALDRDLPTRLGTPAGLFALIPADGAASDPDAVSRLLAGWPRAAGAAVVNLTLHGHRSAIPGAAVAVAAALERARSCEIAWPATHEALACLVLG